VLTAPPAVAASITVNTDLDVAPNAQGQFPTDGRCSLRAAILAAQNNSNGHDVDCSTGADVRNVLDVIQIDPSLAGRTAQLTYARGGVVQALPIISGPANPMMIVGPTTDAASFTISGGGVVRPFVVGYLNIEGGDLRLANLTVANGNGSNGGATVAVEGDGGALYAGDQSRLTFDNVVFRNNAASGPQARGGAVYASAPTITNNGGAYRNNTAKQGGALFLESGPSTFNGYAMLLQDNVASDRGGAIATNPGNATPLIRLERSLIRGNSARFAGVLWVPATGSTGTTFDLRDSTVTGNTSVFETTATTQHFNYERTTFVNTGNLFSGSGAGTIFNSIIKGSSCTYTSNAQNYRGGANLIDAGSCGRMGSLGPVSGLSPTLAQNGGPEVQQTFALLAGSNAIDTGSNQYCGTIDARSVQRGLDGDGTVNSPSAGDCDIGAYEYARYVVNFVTGTSSVNEAAGTASVPVKLRILDPAIAALATALTVPVTNHPTSTATPGAGGDFTLAGGGVTFPAGARDGHVANLVVNVHQDDVAELFGESALLDLGSPPAGVIVAEPKRHTLSIQDDDQAGVIVDDGGNGTTVREADVAAGDAFVVRLQSRPDRRLLNPSAPGDPASYGAPADVSMTVTPDRDCTVAHGGSTATAASPLTVVIANADWRTGRSLVANAVADPWDEDLRDETARHTCEVRFTFDSLDPIYKRTQDAYEVAVVDDDVAGVNLGAVDARGVLAEGSDQVHTYRLSLNTPPDPGKPLPTPARGSTSVTLTPSRAARSAAPRRPAGPGPSPSRPPTRRCRRPSRCGRPTTSWSTCCAPAP
jgi:hypothetical protein